ncbi:hypothetical protein M8J76_005820 [Diaphorina citri]|nr:hypothetical protein M8J76_005820 [Diaphorina citri]
MVSLDKVTQAQILKRLNVELGKERENIILVKNRIDQDQKELLENNPKLLETNITLTELESTLSQIQSVREKLVNFKLEYEDQEKKLKPVSSKIQDNIDKINQLEQAKLYISCLQWVDQINEELKIEYENPYGIELYQRLYKYSPGFEDSIRSIKWPFTSSNVSATQRVPSHEVLLKFKKKLKTLLLIQYPSTLNLAKKDDQTPASKAISFPSPTLPIALLLKPLQKRFLFHFAGSKQTNRIDKPEWFLTLILGWLKDHQDFVERHVQPLYNETGHGNAKIELMRGLVQLCVHKLQSDMSNLVSDDLLFSHTVDEVLGFEKELRDIYCYPSTEPSVLQVFTQPPVLTLWIELEGKFARDKMDIKLYECPELFILLLSTMTERYEALPTLEAKAEFLELQLSLLDEYRLRLIQVMHENESLLVQILNTAHYLHYTVNEWSGALHFILLQQFRGGSGLGSTVFDEILSLLDKMICDLRETTLKSAVVAVTAKARRYCNENWLAKELPSVEVEGSMTPSACLMFKELSSQLYVLHEGLATSLFTHVWENLATTLSNFLFDELILANKFSKAGGKQLHFDITRNLLPLFAHYTAHPERHFNRLLEACHLLSIDQVPKNPLHGLKFLSREDCFRVLRNRSDMNIRVSIHDLE